MQIKYAGPFLDYSGYGECSRHHIGALDAVKVKVIGELLSYSTENADYGTLGALMHKAKEYRGNYDIKLLHSTPDEFKRLIEPNKYHVGFCYWETDKIPQSFAEGLSYVDEVWTGSQANLEAIRAGGVSKPIYVIPEPIEVDREWPKPYQIPEWEGYLFYSIFEWTDRKNPEALIRAYLEEFGATDRVGLLIKTYFRNFSFSNKKMIKQKIDLLREELGVTAQQVPIFVYLDLMDRTQVMRFHQTGDCFVSTHRGEGWGLPQVEAALAGKPVISTGYGGVHEYFDETNSIMLPYKMEPLKGMLHSQRFYSSDQNWAEVDPDALKEAMRDTYKDRAAAKKRAKLAKEFVSERFSFKTVGTEMLNRLSIIEKGL